MKKSVGILLYQKRGDELFIFLAHMGGPYWKDIPVWSILKGERTKDEKALDTAIREFQEECGQKVNFSNIQYLHTEKQKSRKLVTFFCAEGEVDPKICHSNTFFKEYPKGSGQIQEFEEMDQYGWFPIEEAKKRILSGQRKSLMKLEKKVLKKE